MLSLRMEIIQICVEDTDYCTDTPTYNITKYTKWINGIDNPDKYSFDELCTRTNCEGSTFISHNIMDYAFVIQTNLHSSNASVSATYYLTVLLFPE